MAGMDAVEFVPLVDAAIERAVIGLVLRCDRATLDCLLHRVDGGTKCKFGDSLRGRVWLAVRQAATVERRWRTSAAILFAVTRTRAWKGIPAGEPKWVELHRCVNEFGTVNDVPWWLSRMKHLANMRETIQRAEIDAVVLERKRIELRRLWSEENKRHGQPWWGQK